MWQPPERIKHGLPETTWPTATVAAHARWFRPIQLGPTRLETRTWIPAMVPWRSTEEGIVTDDVLDWYGRFAKGQPGALVVEATGIRDIPSGPLLRIGHDRYIEGLQRLVERVREESHGQTRVLIQLIDFLAIKRRPDPEKFLRRFLVVTDQHRNALPGIAESDEAIRDYLVKADDAEQERILCPRELDDLRMGYRERVTDTHLAHIAELPTVLPDLFADAGRRAEAAGFDGIELHYAHAYTMASFLSARNTRTDGYGGSRAERIRLPLEVFTHVRKAVSAKVAVGCRYLSDECINDGSTVDDAAYFGTRFAEAGMDFLSLSRGGKFDDAKQPPVGAAAYPYTGPSGYECMPSVISDQQGPFGRNVEAVAHIRQTIRTAGYSVPVVVAGGIQSFEQAEAILAAEKADIVASARQSLADPDWFLKTKLGAGAQIRRCKFTNYCEALDQKHKQVTCQLWDKESLDAPDVVRSLDGKRRLTAPLWEPPSA